MPYEPKIVAFLCTWCSYTGADTAGISRLKSPANVRAVRVPCSGRVSPELIMRTFDRGADGVIVLACHIGECHYDNGNHRTAKRLPLLKSLMTYAGLEPERIRLDWVSASEGERYARIVTEFTDTIRALGPARWRVLNRKWKPAPDISLQSENPKRKLDLTLQEKKHLNLTTKLRILAAELLRSGEVQQVIGYEIDPRGRTRPVFIHHPEEAEKLCWNHDCTHNLTTYLPGIIRSQNLEGASPRVGVIVKPCDSRAINMQLAENRYQREDIHIIGIVCDGIRSGAGKDKPSSNGAEHLQPRCTSCQDTKPVIYDTLIGEPPDSPRNSDPTELIDELESRHPLLRLPSSLPPMRLSHLSIRKE